MGSQLSAHTKLKVTIVHISSHNEFKGTERYLNDNTIKNKKDKLRCFRIHAFVVQPDGTFFKKFAKPSVSLILKFLAETATVI